MWCNKVVIKLLNHTSFLQPRLQSVTTAKTKAATVVEPLVESVGSPHTSEINCSPGRRDKEGLTGRLLHLTFKCSLLSSSASGGISVQRRWRPFLVFPSKWMQWIPPSSVNYFDYLCDSLSDGDAVETPLDSNPPSTGRRCQSSHPRLQPVLPSCVWIRSDLGFREVWKNLFRTIGVDARKAVGLKTFLSFCTIWYIPLTECDPRLSASSKDFLLAAPQSIWVLRAWGGLIADPTDANETNDEVTRHRWGSSALEPLLTFNLTINRFSLVHTAQG